MVLGESNVWERDLHWMMWSNMIMNLHVLQSRICWQEKKVSTAQEDTFLWTVNLCSKIIKLHPFWRVNCNMSIFISVTFVAIHICSSNYYCLILIYPVYMRKYCHHGNNVYLDFNWFTYFQPLIIKKWFFSM
jgi:hypothetical protein